MIDQGLMAKAVRLGSAAFDENYFMRGQEMGISGYTNYHWMPEMTIPMVCAMVSHLQIDPDDTILDFGCARGYSVRAFREEGYNARGYDISEWALRNCDPTVIDYVSTLNCIGYDWIIAKDVLEHISDLQVTIDLLKSARKGIFAIVPLAHDGEKYDVPEYELDVTHIHRRPLQWWVGQFHEPGWAITAQYRVPGIKDNYKQYPTGNGFITARRI